MASRGKSLNCNKWTRSFHFDCTGDEGTAFTQEELEDQSLSGLMHIVAKLAHEFGWRAKCSHVQTKKPAKVEPERNTATMLKDAKTMAGRNLRDLRAKNIIDWTKSWFNRRIHTTRPGSETTILDPLLEHTNYLICHQPTSVEPLRGIDLSPRISYGLFPTKVAAEVHFNAIASCIDGRGNAEKIKKDASKYFNHGQKKGRRL